MNRQIHSFPNLCLN